jgi:DNA-binding transcriptional LysR family regulator
VCRPLAPNPQLARLIPGFEPVFAAPDYIVQIRAAEAGVGAVVLDHAARRFTLPSPLVALPVSFGKLTSSLHLICARSSLAIPRVKAVADVLAKELTRPLPVRARLSPPPRHARSRMT